MTELLTYKGFITPISDDGNGEITQSLKIGRVKMNLISMVKHPINLFGESDDAPMLVVKPSGMTVRVSSTAGQLVKVAGVPVPVETVTEFHGVQTIVDASVADVFEALFETNGAIEVIEGKEVVVFDGLPAESTNSFYIVSLFAAQAAPRFDVVRPGTGPRDNRVDFPKGHKLAGRLRGVRKLIKSC